MGRDVASFSGVPDPVRIVLVHPAEVTLHSAPAEITALSHP